MRTTLSNAKKISRDCLLRCHLVSLCLERGRQLLLKSFGTCSRCGATFLGKIDAVPTKIGHQQSYAWDVDYGLHSVRLPPCGIREGEHMYLSASMCPNCNTKVRAWESDNDTKWDSTRREVQ